MLTQPPVCAFKGSFAADIRRDYSQYGFDQLIGAIKTRVEKLGGTLRKEERAHARC